MADGLERNIGSGLHRKPSAVNAPGESGGKVFGAPVAVVTAGGDFSCTRQDQTGDRAMRGWSPRRAAEGEIQMKHASDTPTSYRTRFSFNWPKPRGHHTFVLGMLTAVTGLAGSIRRLMEGSGILLALGYFAVGVLGVGLSIAWIVTYAKEH